MKKLAIALTLTATLTACTPDTVHPTGPGTPPPPVTSSSPTTASPSPSPTPSPSPEPSPSFTQAMSADQEAAFDALNHYFHTLDVVQSDPEQDPEQLWDLYDNFELALNERQWINLFRAEGIVQTGTPRYHYREVAEPIETEEGLTVQIRVCGDYHDWDLIDPNGETIVVEEDTRYTEWTYDMIQRSERWLILGRSESRAQLC